MAANFKRKKGNQSTVYSNVVDKFALYSLHKYVIY